MAMGRFVLCLKRLRQRSSNCGRQAWRQKIQPQRERKHSSHDETHFAPREPFPLESWAQCSISRWRDWRAVGGRWSRRRFSADLSGIDVTEFRILNFIDRLSQRAAESRTVTVNLAQGIVASRF